MTDESAKELAAAMNRLAAALENLPRSNGLMPGISVQHQHHGYSVQQPHYPQPPYQSGNF